MRMRGTVVEETRKEGTTGAGHLTSFREAVGERVIASAIRQGKYTKVRTP